MMDNDDMMTEEEPQTATSGFLPAVADPATAALSAGLEPEEDEWPDEEQEDPYAGRFLPGEAEAVEEDDPWEEEPGVEAEEEPEEEALPEVAAAPEKVEAAAAPPAAVPPAPEPPSADDAAAARQRYWRGVLTGSAATVPDAVRERAGVDDPALTEEQREYRLLSVINRSWAADNMGMEREQVSTRWAALRRELAQRFHVADDEQELFTALSVEAQDAPRRERVKALYEAHYTAGLLGQEAPEVPLPAGEEELPWAAELVEEAQRKGKSQRQRYLPLARELAEGLNVFAGMEEEMIAAPRVLSSVPEFARAVDSLAGMDEGTRQLVYALAQAEYRAQHPQQDANLYRTMLRASRRGAIGLGIGVGQFLSHATSATLNSVGSQLGGAVGDSLRKGAAALDLRTRIAEEARLLLYEEVKPLAVSEEAGFVSQLLVDAAGAAPAAVAACSGGAGFAAIGLSGVGESVTAARLRAPEGSPWLQYLAGVVGGGIQASIYSGMGRVGGQLLSNSIGNFIRSTGKGGGSYTLASLGVLGAVGAEEGKLLFAGKSADAVGLGVQELAARLEKTASNIDWSEYGDNAQDVELNMREAAMNLPFILIGSGRVALRHFRSRHAVLGDGCALERWGIDEATRDAIMKEPNIDRQSDLLRDALRGSRRWSAPGFVVEATRALRLLNTDYYQGFKDPQTVVDFLRLPSQGGLVPRPPMVQYSANNPEHVRLLAERHGQGEKTNRARLGLALQLWDEWSQKAHLLPSSAESGEGGAGDMLPTAARRRHFGLELLRMDSMLPPRVRPGGFYAPQAEAERMAMLRDRVAEIHDLSYQMLMSSFPLDALSHGTRGVDHMRQASETARTSILEALGRSILLRATGVPEQEAMDELGRSITAYFRRRRYSRFPPGWMSRVDHPYTRHLDAYARASFSEDFAEAPEELRTAYRVALGLRSCGNVLYELLPTLPDFQTSLARGLSPAEAYVHLLSRELGVDLAHASGVAEILAPLGQSSTDMRSYSARNQAAFEHYRILTGCDLEQARGEENGSTHWRARRPNGSCTRWHRHPEDAINDLVANTSFTFMPFEYDRTEALRVLRPGREYDLNTEGQAGEWQFTGYEHLCRIALRDTARSWVESAPYALPGFEMAPLHRYLWLGGRRSRQQVLMREGDKKKAHTMQVDSFTLSSPLRLAQARFRTYWWHALQAGRISARQAGEELVKLRVMSPEQLEQVELIGKPLLMPRNPNVPLRLTPPPNIAGMNRRMADYLTDFSVRYLLAHLDNMPLPPSAREWFRLAPLCPLEPGDLPERARRISLKYDTDWHTCLHNRVAAREIRDMAPAVADLRLAEREGLLQNSVLLPGLRSAVGLNRTLNLEQAWCTEESGGEAMMASGQEFWYLMESPRDAWDKLPPATQKHLRAYVGSICRLEADPVSVETAARGETPDYVLQGLQNLQDVLSDYPLLHQFGLLREEGPARVRQLTPEEPNQTDPFAEPEYEPVPLYTGGRMEKAYHLSRPMELPEAVRDDSRVLPALYLLGALRTYPRSRPFTRREGIEWKGKLYGGPFGLRPRGMDDSWHYEEPLADMIQLLRHIDEVNATRPKGEKLRAMDMVLPGLEEELSGAPLANVTLYRHEDNPAQLCRLMPGEPESANTAARSPYVVQTLAGINMARQIPLGQVEKMYSAYTPIERFRPCELNIEREKTREKFSRLSLDYTLSGALSSTMRMASQENPQGGLAGMRELLLRFAEDSGFSRSLRGADPNLLSFGEILSLRVARELLLCVCGANPEAAYRRLVRLGHRLRRSKESRDAMLTTLFRSADVLYHKGKKLFLPEGVLSNRQKKYREENLQKHRARRIPPLSRPASTATDDYRNLDEWNRRHGRDIQKQKEDPHGGFNDDVRDDGYSRGFYDD